MKKIFLYAIAVFFFTAQLFAQSNDKALLTTSNKNIEKNLLSKREEFKKQRIENKLQFESQLQSKKVMSKSGFTQKLDSVYFEAFYDEVWNPDSYYTYEIDNNGVLNSAITAFYESFNNDWYRVKTSYTYDSSGKLTTEYGLQWTDSIWEITGKTEMTYDSNSNLINRSAYGWDNVNSSWIIGQKWDYLYDNNKITEEIFTAFNFSTNQWVLQSKKEYFYSGNNLTKILTVGPGQEKDTFIYVNNMLSERIKFTNNTGQNTWKNEKRYTSLIDSNNNTTYSLIENWNGTDWVESQKDMFYYDLNTQISDIAFYDAYANQYVFSNKLDSILMNATYEGFESFFRIKFFYKNMNTSGINKTNVVTTKGYPNPAKDVVNFDLSNMASANEIIVFDMNGKQVLNHSIINGNQIDISQLNKGLYMYKIIGNDNISSGKLIIE